MAKSGGRLAIDSVTNAYVRTSNLTAVSPNKLSKHTSQKFKRMTALYMRI